MALDDAHDLIPAELAASLPALYTRENDDDPTAWIKLFTPDAGWTWFIIEYDPAQRLCFGLTIGHDSELGYFSIDELQEIQGPLGLRIERDLYWTPRPLSQCQ